MQEKHYTGVCEAWDLDGERLLWKATGCQVLCPLDKATECQRTQVLFKPCVLQNVAAVPQLCSTGAEKAIGQDVVEHINLLGRIYLNPMEEIGK